MGFRWLTVLLPLLLVAACQASTPPAQPQVPLKPIQAGSDEYVIGVADLLRVSVWKNPELSTENRVRPDGVITLPLIGDVQAASMTPSELRRVISERLSSYIKDETAVVTVTVLETNSYRVTVSGNVAFPGMFATRHYLNVGEAIAMAGGLNRFASPDGMFVLRRELNGNMRRIPVDYDGIVTGARPNANLMLKAGDTVHVP